MNRYRVIDRASWPRGDLFEYYQGYDSPCYTVSAKVPGEALHTCAKSRGESFFLLALYAILRAANQVPQLRQRVLDGQVVEFERIAVMTPILSANEQFQSAWCEYAPDFPAFKATALPEIETARQGRGLDINTEREDFLCASCVPWLHFEAVAAADFRFRQAVPVLTWGKLAQGLIPFSIKISHSFMDGLHISRFFSALETQFGQPESLWG